MRAAPIWLRQVGKPTSAQGSRQGLLLVSSTTRRNERHVYQARISPRGKRTPVAPSQPPLSVMSAPNCGAPVLLHLMLPGRVGAGAGASDGCCGAGVLEGGRQLI